ncbi:MAG: hypothetical protein DRO23_12850 [Thermoprotei archaeon]|nr:MAG: hypothetical protein DRO23_12850 [Thermoprotei archaeon]
MSDLKKETRIGLIIIRKINEKKVALLLVLRGRIIEGFLVALFKTLFELATSIISTKYYGELRYLIILPLNIAIGEMNDMFLRVLRPLIIVNSNFELKKHVGIDVDTCQIILNHFIKHIDHDTVNFSLKLINEVSALLISLEGKQCPN